MAYVGAKCECEVAMTKNKIFTLQGPQPFELGPAYDDVRHGVVKIDRVWKEDRSLVPQFINDCCVDESAMDFETGERWSDSIVVLVIWFALTLPFMLLFFRYRKYQPLRFRSFSTVLLHYVVMSTIIVWGAMRNAYDRTFSCWFELVVHHIMIPIFIFYYVMKAAQLIFVYEWTTAKANNAMDRVQMFYKYRHFLKNTAYFGAMGLLAAFGAIWLTVEATHPDLAALRDYPTLQGTMRCEWWQIPESYRVPTRKSSFCYCPSFNITTLNEHSDPGDADPLNAFLCAKAYAEACVTMTDPENNREILDFEGRNVCEACEKFPPESPTCVTWFQQMLFQGTCGWWDEAPHFSSCVACLGSSRANLAATLTLLLLELATFMLLWLYARRYNDQLFIRTEGLLCLVVLTPVLCVGLWMLYDDEFRRDTAEKLDTEFDIYAVFMTIAMFWACFVSIILPVIIQMYYRYKGREAKDEYKARKRAKREARAKRKSGSKASQSKPSDSSYPSSGSNFVTGDDTKMFEFAIRDVAARALLRQFCIQEFSVENLDFLVMFNRVNDFIKENDMSDPQVEEQAHEIVKTMYNIHIKMGCPVEVNISHITRNRVINQYIEVFGINNENDRVPKDQLVEWLRPAYNEIRELILSDSWYRFQQSHHYPKLKQQYTADQALGKSAHRAMFNKHEASVTTDKIAAVSRLSERDRGSRFSRAESESTHLPLRSPSTRRNSDDDLTAEVEMAGYPPQLSKHASGKMASEVLGYEPAVAPISPRETIVPEESDRPSSWFFRPKQNLTPRSKSPRGPGARSPRQRSDSTQSTS